MQQHRPTSKKVRYAVVGLGHLAQAAILPAFAHARRNSELVALVSDDPVKRKKLGKIYRVEHPCDYAGFDALLRSGEVDAVYIVLPNHLHREYTERAAEAAVHVLCEKPLAVTEAECRAMIDAAAANRVRLMVAYRLHLDEGTLKAAQIVRSAMIGEVKSFVSAFSMQAAEGVRLRKDAGGGPLYDIGIYCINAARMMFADEPIEVQALTANTGDPRFSEVEEMVSAVLRFPNDRLATFTCSFGAAGSGGFQVFGTKGNLRVDPAYYYSSPLVQFLTVGGKTKKRVFGKHDQFAAQLVYFSDCVLKGIEPEPSGHEGMADVRIVEALYRSAAEGRTIKVEPVLDIDHAKLPKAIRLPPIKKHPKLIHAAPPHR
jgi:glucose-fructose oxidoreductase